MQCLAPTPGRGDPLGRVVKFDARMGPTCEKNDRMIDDETVICSRCETAI